MLTSYTTDGSTTRFTFNWPYLDRSHIMVTRDMAPAMFKFINDYEIEVKTLFGEPLPAGETLKIFRVTPDLVAFAEFKDAANLSVQELNRARLQVLFLVQERSGGLTGSVAPVIQLLVNEIETLSGAMDNIAYSQGLLTTGLQTVDELKQKINSTANEASALRDAIAEAIANFDTTTGTVLNAVVGIEAAQNNLRASVNQSLATLVGNDEAQATRVDNLEARVTAISQSGDDDGGEDDQEELAASLLQTAIASVKQGIAQAQRIETLEAKVGDNVQGMIQEEQRVRAEADQALAQQITTLQAQIGQDLAQVIQDIQTSVSTTNGRVNALNAQYTLKAQVQRADGKPVMAGIGLAATANDNISASEIVMMADRLVFADPKAPDGALRPLFTAGNVDGSPTFIIPANSMGDRTYPGRLLVDGTIEGRSIKANEITGDKLKAGSITTREINVGLGINLLPNGTLLRGGGGWGVFENLGNTVFDYAGAGAEWVPVGGSSITARQTGASWHTASIYDRYAEVTSSKVPAIPGERYEFSVYTGAHRCSVLALIVFTNASGEWIGTVASDLNDAQALGGPTLADFKRIGGFATAPAGTASVHIAIRKSATKAGQADSWLMVTQPMLAMAQPNQTRLSNWSPSGLGTKITPEGITTPSLSALSANIGSLVSYWPDGGRVERDGNGTRVYDQNGVLRVRLGRW